MFGEQARRVERYKNILTDTVKVTLGSEGAPIIINDGVSIATRRSSST